jgi:hypothetical protein
MMPSEEVEGVCYKQALIVKENYQMCDVTNPKIVDILKGQKPQVTFSCNAPDETCNFQCMYKSASHEHALLMEPSLG